MAAQLKIYVNGVRDGSVAESRSLTQRTSSVRIGVGGTVNEPLKGAVDEVRIYNRALSEPEITALHQYAGVAAPAPDVERPSVPAGLRATPSSTSAIALSWTAATDNVGVTGYRVYRSGTRIGETVSPSYVHNGLTPATTYTYTVTAVDAAGNESLPSTIGLGHNLSQPPSSLI